MPISERHRIHHLGHRDFVRGRLPWESNRKCRPLCGTASRRFLNATFGNAAELIIAIFLVREGLFDMVKASITGSIIGNLLLVLGACVFLGGLKYKEQRFNVQLASHNSSLMIWPSSRSAIPAIFISTQHFSIAHKSEMLSLTIAGHLDRRLYTVAGFSMVTHKDVLADVEETTPDHGEEAAWSKRLSVLFLLLATVMTAFVSEWLVSTLHSSPPNSASPKCSSGHS